MFASLFIALLLLPGVLPSRQETSRPVILRFGGDFLIAGNCERALGDSADGAFRNFDLLRNADVAGVNLEGPITTRGTRIKKPFTFRMHPRFLSVFKSAGITVVNLANNHIYDFGEVGLCDTFSYLDSVGIHRCGAGRSNVEAHTPVLFNVRGTRIAVLGYYAGEEAPRATKTRAGVAERSIESIRHDIAAVRAADSTTYVVVNLHWGTENAELPRADQIRFAHWVIDAGANLIVGHHPHVLQGIERYKGGVVVYSLGSFVFGGKKGGTYNTAIFEVRLTAGAADCRLIPTGVEQWRPRELKGTQSEGISRHVRDLSESFSKSIFGKKENR